MLICLADRGLFHYAFTTPSDPFHDVLNAVPNSQDDDVKEPKAAGGALLDLRFLFLSSIVAFFIFLTHVAAHV